MALDIGDLKHNIYIETKKHFEASTGLTNVHSFANVTSNGEYAFYNDSALLTLPASSAVETIGDYAFYNCTSLIPIVIPDSVTSIGSSAFNGCTSLSDVYYIGSEEQWNAISIDKSNSDLYSATIHYNYNGK